ncbi:HepT-like ribonuclease domain-containing protein [Lyngbya confervoides]|uniref:HepT-like ribonuclease domain-containing protein n=1 Tax=Lyngbya confervoides TaxID=207921 RepID=UPI0035C9201A
MTGLRNIIAHTYFYLDADILWDVVQNEFPRTPRPTNDLLPAARVVLTRMTRLG